MATKFFGFNFKPLRVSRSMEVLGSVPARQKVNPADGGHSPDYTLTPLTLFPHVTVRDPNGITPSGDGNQRLANIRWHVVRDGVKSLIDFTKPSGYVLLGAEGSANAGCLEVGVNADPGRPLTLVFSADLPDTATSQVHHVEMSFPVVAYADTCESRIELDCAPQVPYNPLRMPAQMTVNARLMYGGTEVTPPDVRFVWQRLRDDGTWGLTGTDVLDYDVEVSADTASATVRRDLMGQRLCLRVIALYEPGTDPTTLAPADDSPHSVVTLNRYIPEMHCDIAGVPMNVTPGLTAVYPEAVVTDNCGVVTGWESVFDAVWRIGKNRRPEASGAAQPTISYVTVGRGSGIAVPLSAVADMSSGAIIDLTLEDRGPLCALADSDGAVLTDDDGAILLA
ncbi:hypothetical protein E4T81_06335 [Barnesiella sp. WM24]|uniref:hypothetical protein n=1 Tax=Barnesiella sp. WM24 TaxID=2558278 RepID=UPI001072164E|nr:hypothetical protein [Barnesiella sp. WM24]TFU93571.1 hypothetical protein E4T81_06335 [Barnesiella sp. WM24]